jgi:hypothetical protein
MGIESLEAVNDWRSVMYAERLVATITRHVAVLAAPLGAGHGRNVELARENGALTERAAALERELEALRSSSAADQQTVERMRKRLEAVEGANVALTRLLQNRVEERQPRRARGPRLLLLLLLLIVIGGCLCALAAVVWLSGRLPAPFA